MIARVSGVCGVYRILPSSMGFRKDQINAPVGFLTNSRNNDKQNGALKKRGGEISTYNIDWHSLWKDICRLLTDSYGITWESCLHIWMWCHLTKLIFPTDLPLLNSANKVFIVLELGKTQHLLVKRNILSSTEPMSVNAAGGAGRERTLLLQMKAVTFLNTKAKLIGDFRFSDVLKPLQLLPRLLQFLAINFSS